MTNINNKTENPVLSPEENRNGIENHVTIAGYLELAAQHHRDAANYHEGNEHEKANYSAGAAKELMKLAYDAQKKDVLYTKPTL